MSERSDKTGVSTPGFDAATRQDPNASPTLSQSTTSKPTSVGRRAWDFPSTTPGSPFRRLTTPARRAWKTSPGSMASQRVSVLSSSVSTRNPSSLNTTRSMPVQPTDTDDVVSWIQSMKLKAKTIMHSEVEEERRFYEELERDKKLVQEYNEADSEAFEKLKMILEGTKKSDTRSEYHTAHEDMSDLYSDELSDGVYTDEHEAEDGQGRESDNDLYALRPQVLHDIPGVIDLSEDEESEGSPEAHYDPEVFRDPSVSYEITPQHGSMYSSRNSLQNGSDDVSLGNSGSEDYESDQHESLKEEAYDESNEDHQSLGQEVERYQYHQSLDSEEEEEDQEEDQDEDEEDGEYEIEDLHEDDYRKNIDQEHLQETHDYDSEIEYIDEDHGLLEDDPHPTATQPSHLIEPIGDDEYVDEVNLFADGNFELLASAALGNLSAENVHEGEGGEDNQHQTVNDDMLPTSDADAFGSEESGHGENIDDLSDSLVQTHEIALSAESVASGQTAGLDISSNKSSAQQTDKESHLEEHIQESESRDQEKETMPLEEKSDDAREEHEEQHIYYDSDNEAYGSPSHSMFGSIKQEDLSVLYSDDGQSEEVEVGAFSEEHGQNDPAPLPENAPSDIQEEQEEVKDGTDDEQDGEIEQQSFVSFFDQRVANPDVEGPSFADVSQHFIDSLQSTTSDFHSKQKAQDNILPSSKKKYSADEVHLDSLEQVGAQLEESENPENHGNPEIQANTASSIFRTALDAANEVEETSLGGPPEHLIEQIEESINHGIQKSIPLLSTTMDSAVTSVRDIEENALGQTLDEFAETMESEIGNGISKIKPSVSSMINSTLNAAEEHASKELGKTTEEFVESVKEGLHDVGDPVKDAAQAAETLATAISGIADPHQEEEIIESRDEIVGQASEIATQMFETALGESELDLFTGIDGLAEEFDHETRTTPSPETKDLLPESEDEELTATKVTAHDVVNSLSNDTAPDVQLAESTPVKTVYGKRLDLRPSGLRNSTTSEEAEHGSEMSTPLSDAIEHIADSMNALADSIDDWVAVPVQQAEDSGTNTDNKGVDFKEALSKTATTFMNEATSATSVAQAIVAETFNAPDDTAADYVQDDLNDAIFRATEVVVNEVTEVSQAASTWCEEAFAAPDDYTQQEQKDNESVPGRRIENDAAATHVHSESASAPVANPESANAGAQANEVIGNGEHIQKPPSLLKRGWSTLMEWTTSKRVKNDSKSYHVISQTEPAVDPQHDHEKTAKDEPFTETHISQTEGTETRDEPPAEGVETEAAVVEIPTHQQPELPDSELGLGAEASPVTNPTEKETEATIISSCFPPDQNDIDSQDTISKTEEPTTKKSRLRTHDLGQPEHIVMRTRSGRILGANTEEELKLAKLREEEEQRLLSEIVDGGTKVPTSLRDLAVANQFLEKQEVGSNHLMTGELRESDKKEVIEKASIGDLSNDAFIDNQDAEPQDEIKPEVLISFQGLPVEEEPYQAATGDDRALKEQENLVIETKKEKAGDSKTADGITATESDQTLRRSTRTRKKPTKLQNEEVSDNLAANVEDAPDGNIGAEADTEPENTEEIVRGRGGRKRKVHADVTDGKISKPTTTPAVSQSRTRRTASANSKKTKKKTK